jgi:hypothetical protein
MAVACQSAVSTGGRAIHNLAVVQPTQCLVAGQMMKRMVKVEATRATIGIETCFNHKTTHPDRVRLQLKYLLIAALLSFLFVLVYSRLRPYIQLVQKVLRVLKAGALENAPAAPQKAGGDRRLVRCIGCGTWVPADRAVTLNSGLATYCSRECLEKSSIRKEQKLAG